MKQKRFMSLLLTLCMIVSMVTTSVFADTDNSITVTVTLKADTGYWLNNYKVEIPSNDATAYDAFEKACNANSITYKGAEGGYVSSMTKDDETLAEFDKGENSGWLCKINGEMPSVGLTDYKVSDGDTIVWYYTEDWTCDPSAGYYDGDISYTENKDEINDNKPTTDINQYFAFAAEQNIENVIKDTANYILETVKEPEVGSIGGEWAVLGLARSNTEIPEEYFEKYYENVKNYAEKKQGILHDKKYTEYSRVILALTAIGKNPMDISGYNLVSPLGDYDKTVYQGINGAICALIALDSKSYLPESEIREKYINHILEKQTADGGWTISGDTADIDTTAMVLCALSDYRDRDDVKSAIDKALVYISNAQLETGGFAGFSAESSECCCQVIVALSSLGISLDDERFIKNGKSAVDYLLTYYIPQKGFKHTKSEADTNLMATEQALYALVALDRANNNKTSLYDMSDVEATTESGDEQIGLSGKNDAVRKLPVINKGKTFADIVNSPEKSKIEALAERGMINGRTDTEFAPTNTMTRAEFAAIIVKSLGIEFTGENIFSDVKNDSWYKDYVSTAYFYGVIKGVSDTEFNPEGTITKEEAAVMVQRAAKLCGMAEPYGENAVRDILAGFVDYVTSSDWAREALAFCYDIGILPESDIEILPKNAVTREEIASMLYNMLEKSKLL